MNDWLLKMIEGKRVCRAELAALPFADKIKILDKLRQRSLTIAKARKKSGAEDFSSRI